MYKYISEKIKFGSKTFYICSIFFETKIRINILMFYAWCRYCDDKIDNNNYLINKEKITNKLIKLLKIKTKYSYKKYIMKDYDFKIFQNLIFITNFPKYLIFEHLNGYNMDVEIKLYKNIEETILYCYKIGGILGLIIANIINIKDIKILISACELGVAFQITNIARDILEDKNIGRCYLPKIWLKNEFLNINNYTKFENNKFLINIVNKLLKISDKYYKSSIIGINLISFRYAFIIIIVRNIYRAISIKIKTANIKSIKNRQYTNFLEKIIIIIFSILQLIILKNQIFLKIKKNTPTKLWDVFFFK